MLLNKSTELTHQIICHHAKKNKGENYNDYP
jgi:hypothetical protein